MGEEIVQSPEESIQSPEEQDTVSELPPRDFRSYFHVTAPPVHDTLTVKGKPKSGSVVCVDYELDSLDYLDSVTKSLNVVKGKMRALSAFKLGATAPKRSVVVVRSPGAPADTKRPVKERRDSSVA